MCISAVFNLLCDTHKGCLVTETLSVLFFPRCIKPSELDNVLVELLPDDVSKLEKKEPKPTGAPDVKKGSDMMETAIKVRGESARGGSYYWACKFADTVRYSVRKKATTRRCRVCLGLYEFLSTSPPSVTLSQLCSDYLKMKQQQARAYPLLHLLQTPR